MLLPFVSVLTSVSSRFVFRMTFCLMSEDDVFVDKLPSFERRADLLAGTVWAFPDTVDDSVDTNSSRGLQMPVLPTVHLNQLA